MSSLIAENEYIQFVKEIKELIYRHQYEAMKKVNTGMIQLYWDIGLLINSNLKGGENLLLK